MPGRVPDFCITGDYTERGIKGAHGFMTEEVVDHERYLHVVPPELRDVAVLTEPFTIAEKAGHQIRQIVRSSALAHSPYPGTPQATRRYTPDSRGPGCRSVGLFGAMTLMVADCETFVYALAPAPNPGSDIVEAIGGKYYSQGRIPAETKQATLRSHPPGLRGNRCLASRL